MEAANLAKCHLQVCLTISSLNCYIFTYFVSTFKPDCETVFVKNDDHLGNLNIYFQLGYAKINGTSI